MSRKTQNRASKQAPALPGRADASRSNRVMWMLGGGAVVLVVAMIVVAMVVSANQRAPLADGHGSGGSTAVLTNGTVEVGSGAPLTLEIFEDSPTWHVRPAQAIPQPPASPTGR